MVSYLKVKILDSGLFWWKKMKKLFLPVIIVLVLLLSGCSSGTTESSASNAILQTIEVTPVVTTIPNNISQQFTATGIYSDNSIKDITDQVKWSSGNSIVASVTNGSNAGVVKADTVGDAIITASLGEISGASTITVTNAVLQKLVVTAPQLNMATGTNEQFSVTGIFSDNTVEDLTSQVNWSSSNSSVATVSNTLGNMGLVAALTSGNSVISAKYGQLSGSANLTVTSATLKSVAVTPINSALVVGTQEQFVAIATFSDNTTQNVTNQANWTSNNSSVATVSSNNGVVAGDGTGNAKISAAFHNVTGDTLITVTNSQLKAINITVSNPNIPAGLTEHLTAIGVYSDNTTQDLTNQVVWSSNNPAIASISNATGSQGVVFALATGNTTVNANFKGVAAHINLDVSNAVLDSIMITPVNANIPLGVTTQFSAVGTYSDNSTKDITSQVTWNSEDDSIATISNARNDQGRLIPLMAGSAKISATLSGISASTTAVITNAVLQSINVTPVNSNLALGLKEQFSAIGMYSDGTTKDITTQVTWGSATQTVAIISNAPFTKGQVVSVAPGSSVISATISSISGSTNLNVTNAQLSSITIIDPNPIIPVGLTEALKAVGNYSDDTTKDITSQVTWSSSAGSIAQVNNARVNGGVLTARAPGSANIIATMGQVNSSVNIKVTSAVLESIVISPGNNYALPLGLTKEYSATGTYSDGLIKDITSQVTWSSSAPNVATISNLSTNKGLLTSVTVGNSTITATLNGITQTATMNVTGAVLSSITLSPLSSNVPLGLTEQFSATGIYSNGTQQDITKQVAWNTGSSSIATISNASADKGKLTTLAAGNTTVSAILNGVTANTPISVSAVALQSITLSPLNSSVAKGTEIPFKALGIFSNGTQKDITGQVTWKSGNSGIVAISNLSGSAGVATGLQTGTTIITATLNSVSQSTNLNVTSPTLQSFSISPLNSTTMAGLTQQFSATGTYSDGSRQPITAQVNWSSGMQNIATINNMGLLTAVSPGTTIITASLNGMTQTATAVIVPTNYKAITYFGLTNSLSNNVIPGLIGGQNIYVPLPPSSNFNNLIASFTTTGQSVSVGGNAQVSGSTANNFSSPVGYTVTAADSSFTNYLVTAYSVPRLDWAHWSQTFINNTATTIILQPAGDDRIAGISPAINNTAIAPFSAQTFDINLSTVGCDYYGSNQGIDVYQSGGRIIAHVEIVKYHSFGSGITNSAMFGQDTGIGWQSFQSSFNISAGGAITSSNSNFFCDTSQGMPMGAISFGN